MAPCFLGCTMVFNDLLARIVQRKPLPKKVTMHDAYISKVCMAMGGKIVYDSTVHMMYRQHDRNVIGGTIGMKNALERRFNIAFCKKKVGTDRDAKEILRLYNMEISSNKRTWISQIAHYNDNVGNRIRIAMSLKFKSISLNMAISIRIALLLGNF